MMGKSISDQVRHCHHTYAFPFVCHFSQPFLCHYLNPFCHLPALSIPLSSLSWPTLPRHFLGCFFLSSFALFLSLLALSSLA
ncbi:MAG: hypothetical protein JOS17DRAFT_763411 [Linnemannia elongata]|nr:MAG: hypothetical protein JOS17DRAFT_763411 [Linnemannia elongata]